MESKDLRVGNLVYYHGGNDQTFCKPDQPKFLAKIKSASASMITWTVLEKAPDYYHGSITPIKITEKLLTDLDFEYWDKKRENEFEIIEEFVLHNIIDGSSDFKVCKVTSNYGDKHHEEWIIKIDNDTIYTYYTLEYIHQIQNVFWALTGKEVPIN